MDKGMDDVSRARETTIIDTTNLEITDGIVEEFESERFTKYRNDLDDQARGRSKPTTNNPAANTMANTNIAILDTLVFDTLICLISDIEITFC